MEEHPAAGKKKRGGGGQHSGTPHHPFSEAARAAHFRERMWGGEHPTRIAWLTRVL